MQTRVVKTEDLEGPELRFAFALAMGYNFVHRAGVAAWHTQSGEQVCVVRSWEPDRDWKQLGAAFPRFGIEFRMGECEVWAWATNPRGRKLTMVAGLTHQEAACRAAVEATYGNGEFTLPADLSLFYNTPPAE